MICDTCAPQALNSPGVLEDAPSCQSSAQATCAEVKAGTRAGAAVNMVEARLGVVFLQVQTLWTLHLLDLLFVYLLFFFSNLRSPGRPKVHVVSLALLPHE